MPPLSSEQIASAQELVEANKKLNDLNKELDAIGKILVRRDLELTEANHRLFEMDQIKSRFISVAAHQLRTPITGIKWSLLALADHINDFSERDQKTIKGGLSSSKKAVQMINQLLNVSRIEDERGEFTLISQPLKPIIDGAIANMHEELDDIHMELKVTISDTLPPLKLDAEKFNIAIENLLENAIRYSGESIVLAISAAVDGDVVRIEITDEGIGIPSDQISHIFNKFFRAHNAILFRPDGTGLGLHLTEHIVKKHNGTISVASQEGKGTTFTILLPLAK